MESAWLPTHPAALPADLAAAASQPAAAAAPSPSSPSNIGLQLWHLLGTSLLKPGPPPFAKAVRLMSAAPRRKQLANSVPWLVKLQTTKLASNRSPSRTVRRVRRNLINNFPTTLPPASRVLDLGHRNSFPTRPLPII